mmetsp:Transcript_3667/g.7015  ORF Transcript_3667/g.7015 Transcript_3667/m.7015 type:complete len:126 (-) Transcript_3667:3402-3779(-)
MRGAPNVVVFWTVPPTLFVHSALGNSQTPTFNETGDTHEESWWIEVKYSILVKGEMPQYFDSEFAFILVPRESRVDSFLVIHELIHKASLNFWDGFVVKVAISRKLLPSPMSALKGEDSGIVRGV